MNDQKTYPNSGALFARQKRSQNSADVGGDFTIDGDVLDYIVREARKGSVKLEISGWRKMGRNNQPWTSIKVAIPYALRENLPDRQQPNYQRGSNQQQRYQGNDQRAVSTDKYQNNYQASRDGWPNQSHQRPIADDDSPPW